MLLSEIKTFSLIIEFFITTLFLMIEFLPIETPLPIKQLLPIFTEGCILANFEIDE